MIEELRKLITTAIHGAFPNVPIYTDHVEQGLIEPCFFVFALNSDTDVFLDKRYQRETSFVIQYLDSNRDHFSSVADTLFDVLEVLDNTYRVRGFRTEDTDDAMSVFCRYNFFAYKVEEFNPMETLDYNVKG